MKVSLNVSEGSCRFNSSSFIEMDLDPISGCSCFNNMLFTGKGCKFSHPIPCECTYAWMFTFRFMCALIVSARNHEHVSILCSAAIQATQCRIMFSLSVNVDLFDVALFNRLPLLFSLSGNATIERSSFINTVPIGQDLNVSSSCPKGMTPQQRETYTKCVPS